MTLTLHNPAEIRARKRFKSRIEKAGRMADKAMTAARYDMGENPTAEDMKNYEAHALCVDAAYCAEEKAAKKTLNRALEKLKAPDRKARAELHAYKPIMGEMPPENLSFMKKWLRAQVGSISLCAE